MKNNGANARYQARREQIKLNLEKISRLLEDHAEEQSKHPSDWGFAGDIGEVGNKLEAAVKFLGGDPIKIGDSNNLLLYPVARGDKVVYVTVPKKDS